MSTDLLWPHGPPSDEELEPLYEEVMNAIERDDVAEGLAFKFVVGNLMDEHLDEAQAIQSARASLAFYEETAEDMVSRIFADWHAKEAMKDSIQQLGEKLGIKVAFEPEPDLSKYKRGEIMTAGEARKLKDGDVVWWRYRKYGDVAYGSGGWRVNSAFRIKWAEQQEGDCECLLLDDGSSFGGEWQLYMPDNEKCFCLEHGEDFLHHAVLKEDSDV